MTFLFQLQFAADRTGGSEVLIVYELSDCDRTPDGEQSSGELLRSGCIQRYVGDK